MEKLTSSVCALARETAGFIKSRLGGISSQDIEMKGLNDFVTHIDKEAERRLVDGLTKLLPEAGFITEENTSTLRGRHYEWIVDPLDGTTNFIHGIPLFSVSIALREGEEIVMGVICEPNLGETFYTWKGAPSFCNGAEIHVSQTETLEESLIVTGFPNRNYEHMEEYMSLLNDLMFSTHGIRRLGSAAVDLAWVACGRCECFYEYYLSPWDVAAGALIVQNAGGTVSDFSGGGNYLFGREIIATNSAIYQEFLMRLKKYFQG